MDREIGIEGYLTTTPGIGGLLKASPDDFVVEEIPDAPPAAPDGRFAIATVRPREGEANKLGREAARAPPPCPACAPAPPPPPGGAVLVGGGRRDRRAGPPRLFSFQDVPPEALQAIRLG